MDEQRGSGWDRALALGFAMAVTMWALGYVGRLPVVMSPSWLLAVALLTAIALWGWYAGRATASVAAGAAAGTVAAVVNLLILGSLLARPEDGAVRPHALLWLPGSILAVAGLAAVAAAVGARSPRLREGGWLALLTRVGVVATFLLVVAGGLVTSNEAGLAVVDWPRTFGSNMFLYPLSRMTGGIFYEHAHRLFGALVGLTTIVIAVQLWRRDDRRWVRRLAAVAVLMVMLQGLLGGLRVTGRLTLSTQAADMAPSIDLAVVHGVLGQLFLAVMVVLAASSSVTWRNAGEAETHPAAGADRTLQLWLVVAIMVQLVLGAIQRHLEQGILIHVVMASIVTVIALAAGVRAWALHGRHWPVGLLGRLLMIWVGVQVSLGIAALAVTGGKAVVGHPSVLEVTLTTAHQAGGAALLALAVALTAWTRRRVAAPTPGT